MKKKHLFFISSLALSLVACDPAVDDMSMPAGVVKSADELAKLIKVTHDKAEYFNYDADGLYVRAYDEAGNLLGEGSKATIKAAPGGQAKFTFVYTSFDGKNVEYVCDNLEHITQWDAATPSWQAITGNAEGEYSKSTKWKFDPVKSWGNGGYQAGPRWADGTWWGPDITVLTTEEQLANSGGKVDPEADFNSRMEFGPFNTKWDKDGNVTKISAYEIDLKAIDGSDHEFTGTLVSDAILFNWKINGNGTKVRSFEVLYLNTKEGEQELELCYAAPGTGGWSEATYWRFVGADAKAPEPQEPAAPVKWQSEELAFVTNIVKDKSGKDDGDTTAFKTGKEHKYTFDGLNKFNLASDYVIITKKDDKFETVNVGAINYKVINTFRKDTTDISDAVAFDLLTTNIDIVFDVDDQGELKSTTMYLTEYDTFGNESLMLTTNPEKADTLSSKVEIKYKEVVVKHVANASVSGSRAVYTFENVNVSKKDDKTGEYDLYTFYVMNTLHESVYSTVYHDIIVLGDSNFEVVDGGITIKTKPAPAKDKDGNEIKGADGNPVKVETPVLDNPVTIEVEITRTSDGGRLVIVNIKK